MCRFWWYFEQQRAKGKIGLSEDKASEVQESSGILGLKRRSKSSDVGQESWISGPEMRRFWWSFERMQAKRKGDRSEDKADEVQESSGILGPKRRSKSLAGGEESRLSGPEMRRSQWYSEQKRPKSTSGPSEDRKGKVHESSGIMGP